MTIAAGIHKGRGVAGSQQYGVTKNQNDQIVIDLELFEVGMVLSTFLIFSDASAQYSIDRLRAVAVELPRDDEQHLLPEDLPDGLLRLVEPRADERALGLGLRAELRPGGHLDDGEVPVWLGAVLFEDAGRDADLLRVEETLHERGVTVVGVADGHVCVHEVAAFVTPVYGDIRTADVALTMLTAIA